MAAFRARATALASPLCSDPWAADLAGAEGFELASKYDAVNPHMQLWTAIRTAFIDQCVRRSLDGEWAIPQVVLLGAGFDTRAARLGKPGVRYFEVDHPDTQAEKLRRIAGLAGYPREAATYVACDFEQEEFLVVLRRAGFRPHVPALFIWEGVTPYLTEDAVRGTLRRLAEGADPQSVVVFDLLSKRIVDGEVAEGDLRSREFVGDLGEPLRWGTDDVLPILYAEGFRRVRTTSFDEACLDLTGTYERDRKFRFQSLAVASKSALRLP